MIDYKAREAFVSTDTSYAELERKAQEVRDEASSVHAELVRLTYKMQRLLILRDVALEQMWKLEDLGDEADATLKDLTANNGEAWCGMVGQGIEDLQEMIFTLCNTIAEQSNHHKALELERKDRWDLVWAKGKELRAAWDAMQKEKPEA